MRGGGGGVREEFNLYDHLANRIFNIDIEVQILQLWMF